MNRRGLLKPGVLAARAAGGMLAMPAVARSQPTITWKLASIFVKTLDIQFTTETIARIASELTDGKFQIQIFAAGEIVPRSRSSTRCRRARSRLAIRPSTTPSARTRLSKGLNEARPTAHGRIDVQT